jgi:hypothetical protein
VKIAHIVPPKALPFVPSDSISDFHLLLPSLFSDIPYRDYYKKLANLDYLIMDNGVAEGRGYSFPTILQMSRVMGVQEIVLPDIMGNMDRTLRAAAQVFYPAFENRHHFKFMFVVQGENWREAIHCAERAMNMFPGLIYCFGVPRHFLRFGGGARATIVEALRTRWPVKPIHLLGTHPEYPMELLIHSRTYRDCQVRSCDTSMAWNATLREHDLGSKDFSSTTIIERQPIDEFKKASFEHSAPRYVELFRKNLEVIESWTK